MKKLISIVLVLVLALCAFTAASAEGVAKEDLKVGVILLHDENLGYDLAHITGVEAMKAALGLSDEQVIYEYGIPENEECLDAAKRLVAQGCQIIFADSFSHEDYMIEAAASYPTVTFCHATGYQAASSGLANMKNYFTNIFEARYVSGIVAGMKLAEAYGADIEAKIGYVGAYSYAEVVSGFTAFYLGVRSICPNITMEVKYTGSWADQAIEREVALALIEDGCILISQHADTTGAASACEEKGVLHVGYNVAMFDTAPNTTLCSSTNNWGPYYTYAVQCILDGEDISTDYALGYADGAVKLAADENGNVLNAALVAEGTEAAVEETIAKIVSGELKVFDNSTWTVGGETITSTADIDGFYGVEHMFTDENGVTYFAESDLTLGSAPAFSFIIDGITELNQMY